MEKLAVAIFLIAFMFIAGLQCDYRDLLTALSGRARMARILVANFIVVPILAVIVVRLFALDDFVATGILLMAIAPGVPFLPMIAGAKKGGSAGLATGLAVVLPAISVVTVLITAPLVLPVEATARIRFAPFIINLVLLQLLPVIIGLWLRERVARLAPTLIKVASVVLIVAGLAVLYFIVPRMGHAFVVVYGTRALMATLAVVILSGVAGWAFGGTTPEYRRTITIATIMRNFGLALLIAGQNFEGTIVSAVVLAYFVIQFVLANVLGTVLKRRDAAAPALS
jgi:bile acid:Na+ symporter, BASS family